jgi:two-component system response regulator GlrR
MTTARIFMTDPLDPITTSLGFGIARSEDLNSSSQATSQRSGRNARILVVDSDPDVRRLVRTRLGTAAYSVEEVDNAQAALDACVRSRPNLVITDWRLRDMDGFALLKELKGRWPDITVIVLTAHGTISEAVQATQHGAFGFLVKPVEKWELLGQVERAIAHSTFSLVQGDWRADIVSRSKLMEERLGQANWAAGNDEPVLLTGENGTGKELLARAIHAASARREMPFITVNCRADAQPPPESALLGGDAGRPGNSQAPSSGAMSAARGGTLWLDEIGELSGLMQVKLAQALRAESLEVSSGGRGLCDKARLICSTSCDLKQSMESGQLLEDLYYRINILPIEIPPLGRRREDIPLLVSHFLEQATCPGGSEKIYSPAAIRLLATTDWPGNVRQLFDLVKRNVALSQEPVMSEAFVQESLGSHAATVPTYDEAREKFSHEYLANNLQNTAGDVSESARIAKRNRTDFYRLLARYRVRPEDFKAASLEQASLSED